MHFRRCPHAWGIRTEFHLTTLFSSDVTSVVTPVDATPTPKKRGWLPLLTVLFLISYGLMTMLIVEQGATIDSQRALIRELFRDSSELSSIKLKAQQAANAARQQQSSQTPSTQTPSAQAPSQNIPSPQAIPQSSQNQSAKEKTVYRAPTRPAADLNDELRRLITI
jgi:hypothetical protein